MNSIFTFQLIWPDVQFRETTTHQEIRRHTSSNKTWMKPGNHCEIVCVCMYEGERRCKAKCIKVLPLENRGQHWRVVVPSSSRSSSAMILSTNASLLSIVFGSGFGGALIWVSQLPQISPCHPKTETTCTFSTNAYGPCLFSIT